MALSTNENYINQIAVAIDNALKRGGGGGFKLLLW